MLGGVGVKSVELEGGVVCETQSGRKGFADCFRKLKKGL